MAKDKAIIRNLQARKSDRLLRGVMEGKTVICAYEPHPPAKRPARTPIHEAFGRGESVDGHLVVTSKKITFIRGVIYVTCPECGDQLPLYKVGLRHIGGDLRNQSRCMKCRKHVKKAA